MGAFPNERVDVYRQAATELELSYEEVPNSDPRISDPLSFMQAREGEQVVLIDLGFNPQPFWDKVNEIDPPPPPIFLSSDPDLIYLRSEEPISEGRI